MIASWVPLALPVALAAASVSANAFVSLQIKFSPDAETARQRIKDGALRALFWVLGIVAFGQLLWSALSEEPLTRQAVAGMVFNGITIAILFANAGLSLLLGLVGRVIKHMPGGAE